MVVAWTLILGWGLNYHCSFWLQESQMEEEDDEDTEDEKQFTDGR